MPRQSKINQKPEAYHGAKHVEMQLEQIETKYTSDIYAPNMAAAFALYLVKNAGKIDVEELTEFLKETLADKDLCDFIKKQIGDHWADFRRLIAVFSIDWLRKYLLTHQPLFAEASIGTAETICDLALAILQPDNNETVCDICCGTGVFMTQMVGKGCKASFAGRDISELAVKVSKIRAHVLGIQADIIQQNMLDINAKQDDSYDKIFIDPPYGVRLQHLANIFNMHPETLLPAFPKLKGANSSELVWAARALSMLNKDGRAVMVVTNGALSNLTDAPIRQYLVDRGIIECIIALPERLQSYTPISLSMLVLNKNGNNSRVKMIDATELFERRSRVNRMEVYHINAVVDSLIDTGQNHKDVPISKIAENNYLLSVKRYTMPEVDIPNGRKLGELCSSISRGVSLSREEFHDKKAQDEKGIPYLTIANIQDGVIDDNLPTLKDNKQRFGKYLIRSGDLVLTKVMAPCKVTVVAEQHDRPILGTANFFIIKPNTELLNPYFLMAFLRSKKGMQQLEQLATGTSVRTLGQAALENMLVPVAPIKDQKTFAQDYRSKLETIRQKRQTLDECLTDMNMAYDKFEKEMLSK